MHSVDARPSDALNLVLRMNAPILVAPEVLDQAAIQPIHEKSPTESGYVLHQPDGRQVQGRDLLTMLEEFVRQNTERKGLPPETPEMEYLSFRSLPRGDLGDKLKPAAK